MRATAAVALVASLAMAAFAADPEQCGLYESTCQNLGNDKVSTSMVISGAYTGDILIVTERFSDGTCSSADVSIQAVGHWMDLGNDTGVGRYWQVTYSEVTVTPNTDAWVQKLNNECPCTGKWKKGQERALTACVPGTCDTTDWVGGLTGANTKGIQIGNPAFGFSSADDKEITISFLDADYSTGIGLTRQDTWQTVTRSEGCGATTPRQSYCGVWTLRCSPSFISGAMARTGQFVYEGPVADLYASGIYKDKTTYYADSACATPMFSVETEATFETNGVNINIDGADMVKYNAPFMLVRPLTDDATKMLKHDCPCGNQDLWATNTARRLTSCTLEQCNVDFWNNQTLTAGTFHGNMYAVSRNDSTPELRRTPVVSTPFQAKSQRPGDLQEPYILSEDTCKYPYDSVLEICGSWNQKCHGVLAADEEISLVITGSAGDPSQGEGTGVITRERLRYQHGSGCSSEPSMMINDVGYWTDMGNSTTVPGARNILITFTETVAEVFDNTSRALLNNHFNGCPCNGTWEIGRARVLHKCPPKTCPDRFGIFGNGAIGTPGYGIIRDQEDLFRMSSLHDNPTDGFDEFLQLDDYPFHQTELCRPPPLEDEYGGVWERPCNPGDAGLDFKGVMEIKGNKYEMRHTFYTAGFGCLGTVALRFLQQGKIDIGSRPNQIPNGRELTLKPAAFEVTPLNQDAVNALTQECPCSVGATIWAVNRTITFKQPCPPNTCNNFAFLRQPLGGHAYGVLLRYGQFLRMTKLLSDKVHGFAQSFTAQDFYWVLAKSASNKSGNKGIDAGGVLLLIAFFGGLAYLAAGMVFNYQRSGVPRIPHAEFWTSLPGLISDGFAFTLSGFGLFGRSRKYAAMTNVAETDTSSYGAL
ncbi:hypothetical protein PTSG_11853 [Salpingoeca rosetta]|uniref:Uncharacterized protein n=1 Tax=Salpingoeca rosetta (strain ATCC 50818 / BSB-021) TaxID=946362 RepID=F2U1L5_SALR5|nr:uncharacterized protein PTSG_11853 [Salpingoeca rosetta]EGD81517.1 hypothetical protein PTSG_11853 [Salpingoeca rosetta]|eukprot:XP_004996721.1 hypothetical protein PTSG_11853 [Salpingoeca rosetta]